MPGETVMLAVVAPPGLHKYPGVAASVVAVSIAEPPAQIVAEFADSVGCGFTVKATTELVMEPLSLVMTTE